MVAVVHSFGRLRPNSINVSDVENQGKTHRQVELHCGSGVTELSYEVLHAEQSSVPIAIIIYDSNTYDTVERNRDCLVTEVHATTASDGNTVLVQHSVASCEFA